MIYIREAHPGERMPAHRALAQKIRQARIFREAEDIPWPVLVDALDGSVHHAYTGLPGGLFLIDAEGKLAIRTPWLHGPTLRRALGRLLAQGDRGVVAEPSALTPHLLGPTFHGWSALERAGRPAARELLRAAPPVAALLWTGDRFGRLLARLPAPRAAGPVLGLAALLLVAAALGRGARRPRRRG